MSTTKGAVPDDLLSDILEQPAIWREKLKQLDSATLPLSSAFTRPGTRTQWLGIGEGSSYWALQMALPFLNAWFPFPVNAYTPEALSTQFNQLEYWETIPQWLDGKVFLPVSQSGETASILNILNRLAQFSHHTDLRHLVVVPVVNTIPSSLSQRYVPENPAIAIGAGKERYIAATKSTSTTLLTLLLTGFEMARHHGWLDSEHLDATHGTLMLLPEVVEQFIQEQGYLHQILHFAQRLKEEDHFILLSKGIIATLLPEAGLKLMETSRNLVYTDNSEGFKHGPKVLLQGTQHGSIPNTLYVIPPDEALGQSVLEDYERHFAGSGEHSGFDRRRTFFIRFENGMDCASLSDPNHCLTLPAAHSPLCTVFLTLVTFQLISFFLAWLKGHSPDNVALSKAVTE